MMVDSEYSKKAESMLCPFDDGSGVGSPNQVQCAYPERGRRIRAPLMSRGWMLLSSSEVYNNLLCPCGAQDRVVLLGLHRQLLHLVPVCTVILLEMSPIMVVSSTVRCGECEVEDSQFWGELVLRLMAGDTWGPTLTLWERSVKKSLILWQTESHIPSLYTFDTSLLGRIL